MRTVTLKLDESTHARLRSLAAVRRRTPHWMMKEAIATYLEYEEEDEAFKQRALEAWQQYQEDGLHLTHEEMGAWLAQLKQAGEDAPEPAFHQ
ncbi:MAG: ribbon-helix-helix protein, CopG family [Ottowia sp.]|nr:ribbon-helix-helix protein, CopG family [Ottowia sp.]